jgi:RNA polymerase-binding protein DksA
MPDQESIDESEFEDLPDSIEGEVMSAPVHSESTAEGTSGASPQDEIEGETPFSDEELEHFRQLLIERRESATEEVQNLKEQIENAKEQSDNDSAYSLHMADAGTDAMEREKLYLMIARQQKYIGYLDRALESIDKGTYGICRVTGDPISKERLEAVPHTEISIEAKKKQKKSS